MTMRTCFVNVALGIVENVVDMGIAPPAQIDIASGKPRYVEDVAPAPGYLFVPNVKAGPKWLYVNGQIVEPAVQAQLGQA